MFSYNGEMKGWYRSGAVVWEQVGALRLSYHSVGTIVEQRMKGTRGQYQ